MLFKDLLDFKTVVGSIISYNPSTPKDMILDNAHFNSSLIKENGVFFALTGGARDGHTFIESAIENGAKVIVFSNAKYDFSSNYKDVCFIYTEDTLVFLQEFAKYYRTKVLKSNVIAITGSNGKTTTKDILFHLLSTKYKTHKTIANLNNHIGVPLSILNAPSDTEQLILELGMNHFHEIEFLVEIAQPNYAVITSIGESHIEFLGSRSGIAKAKSEITSQFGKGDKLYLPRDSDMIFELLSLNEKRVPAENINLFGCNGGGVDMPESDKSYRDILYTSLEQEKPFHETFKTTLFDEKINLPLLGEHNINNALACIGISFDIGMKGSEIANAMSGLSITPMRFEFIPTNKAFTIINDAYNASPSSMKANVKTFLQAFKDKKRILVLGDMYELGNDTYALHEDIGKFLNDYKDEIEVLVTVGEYSSKISASFAGTHRHFKEKTAASDWLKNFNHEDFALFFKASRGMKMEEIIQTIQ